MATASSKAVKHWSRIIKQWPVDKVRPENVSFQRLMQQRVQRSTAPAALSSSKDDKTTTQVRPWNESTELRQADVLYSLLDNKFANSYPMPEALRHPKSAPTYYDDLVQEMSEAPSRSWFDGFMKRIRGSLRLK